MNSIGNFLEKEAQEPSPHFLFWYIIFGYVQNGDYYIVNKEAIWMRKAEVGLFIVRLVLGMTFLFHGFDKFQAGLGNIADYFVSHGLPEFLAYVVCAIEFFGGIAMILGIGIRIVSVLFSIVMLGAIFTVKISAGFIGGLELDVMLLAVSIQLAISGSTFLSLDQYIIDSKKSMFSA